MNRFRFVAPGAALAAFLVYLLTLAPSVLFIDSGELATVATTLGIAHPTGYPLFTLVGYIFSHLPIGGSAVWRLNVMAAFFCAAGVGTVTLLARHLLLRAGAKDGAVVWTASALAALTLAFSQTYWNQATAIEVYSLHAFLVPLSILLFLRYTAAKPAKTFTLEGVAWAVVWGLAFANHMTTILLIPAFVWMFFHTFGWNGASFKRGLLLLLPFAVGLSAYLYLPLRAAQHPWENWGNPVTMENFIRHWTGVQYQVWMFTSFDAAGKQFKYFAKDFPTEFGLLGLPLLAAGVWWFFKRSRATATFLIVLFATCVLYSINYEIHDIDSYFLLAYIASGLIFAGALVFVAERFGGMRAAAAVGALAAVIALAMHWKESDDSKNYLVQDYSLNVLNGLAPNAIVISWQWDFFVSASIYYQQVEHVRPDVIVIDKELLRRSWYLDQLEHNYPELYAKSRGEIARFRVELQKFERDEPYNPTTIEQRYRDLIRSFITYNVAERPVYVTSEIENEYTAGYQRIPEGLALRLAPTDEFREYPLPHWAFRDFPVRNYYTDKIRETYMFLTLARGQYLMTHGRNDEARAYLDYSLSFAPHTSAPADDPVARNLTRLAQEAASLRAKIAR